MTKMCFPLSFSSVCHQLTVIAWCLMSCTIVARLLHLCALSRVEVGMGIRLGLCMTIHVLEYMLSDVVRKRLRIDVWSVVMTAVEE